MLPRRLGTGRCHIQEWYTNHLTGTGRRSLESNRAGPYSVTLRHAPGAQSEWHQFLTGHSSQCQAVSSIGQLQNCYPSSLAHRAPDYEFCGTLSKFTHLLTHACMLGGNPPFLNRTTKTCVGNGTNSSLRTAVWTAVTAMAGPAPQEARTRGGITNRHLISIWSFYAA